MAFSGTIITNTITIGDLQRAQNALNGNDGSARTDRPKGRVLNTYSLEDFKYSLQRTDLDIANIEKVLGAWGNDTDGWQGGFLMKLKDGRYLHLSGWCDTSGWGCQDGAELEFAKHPIDLKLPEHLDEDPVDLNQWLENPDQEFLTGFY